MSSGVGSTEPPRSAGAGFAVAGAGKFALNLRHELVGLGGIVERFLFQRLYGKEELYQLLFTYALVLVLGDAAKIFWGTQQKSLSRPPELTGAPLRRAASI